MVDRAKAAVDLPAATPKYIDPRYGQIAVLSSLFCYGSLATDFFPSVFLGAALFVATLLTAWLIDRWRARRFDWRSPMITTLGLALLLRTRDPAMMVLAGPLAMLAKALLQANGRHFINPANFALVVLVLAGHWFADAAWISPGQWGRYPILVAALAAGGLLVTGACGRRDLALIFSAGYIGGLFARAWWLGDPLHLPLNALSHGGLVIFIFFMITDPRSTPWSATGRLIFGLGTAMLSLVIQFYRYEPLAPFYALFLMAWTTPLLDRWFRGEAYQWPGKLRRPQFHGV